MIGTVRISILIIGAVFACTAPFIHIFYPKKHPDFVVYEKQLEQNKLSEESYILKVETLKTSEKFIGFSNIRKFWYAAGKPIAMLYFAILLVYIYPFIIVDKYIRWIVGISASLFLFISIYFITWTLWHRQDFPKHLYYWAIGLVALIGTIISVLINRYNIKRQKNLHSWLYFVVRDIKQKYISAEDKEQFVRDYTDQIEKLR
ncbi:MULTISPECIES: hypothetical protein [Aquimarina]|uniref:hypothetical protein n=1 Tax=Aquimarina TaxID=290174 RepID=UPI0003FF88F3|nr:MULTISPECIES: hypothetical protein [Aquimarina]